MSHPIELNDFVKALEDLSQGSIENAKSELFVSISKLVETNSELHAEIARSTSTSDTKLYKEIIEENQAVIYSKTARYEAALDALRHTSMDEETYQKELNRVYEIIRGPDKADPAGTPGNSDRKGPEDGSIYL